MSNDDVRNATYCIKTASYSICPSCGEPDSPIDHLLGTDFYTCWYCDHCGQRYRLVFSSNGSLLTSIEKGRRINTVDLLCLLPQESPVYFVVRGMRFEDGADDKKQSRDDLLDDMKFFYEEHSCPTNWLDPEEIYFDGRSDPHGLIKFVDTVDEDKECEHVDDTLADLLMRRNSL